MKSFETKEFFAEAICPAIDLVCHLAASINGDNFEIR
jgi:hypothetical protein